MIAAGAAAAGATAPFRARLAGAGAFPGADRPRVVWLGMVEGSSELAALAGTLADELAARGWERDARPFRAHLTLGRADGVPGARRAVDALAGAAASLDASWSADRLVVYQSELGRGPARYRPLATALLGHPPGPGEMSGPGAEPGDAPGQAPGTARSALPGDAPLR